MITHLLWIDWLKRVEWAGMRMEMDMGGGNWVRDWMIAASA